MGYETKCAVRVKDASGTRSSEAATVLLETDEVIVRGDARVKMPRADIKRVAVQGDTLTITSSSATITLTLGAAAATRWKSRLEAPPKAVIDKLDVKPGAKVWMIGLDDETLIAQLRRRTDALSTGRSASDCDVVFVQIDTALDLTRLDRARKAIHDGGAIWAVHPKGVPAVADVVIFRTAKELGLTYTKVARVSETLTAEKLVIPVSDRKARK